VRLLEDRGKAEGIGEGGHRHLLRGHRPRAGEKGRAGDDGGDEVEDVDDHAADVGGQGAAGEGGDGEEQGGHEGHARQREDRERPQVRPGREGHQPLGLVRQGAPDHPRDAGQERGRRGQERSRQPAEQVLRLRHRRGVHDLRHLVLGVAQQRRGDEHGERENGGEGQEPDAVRDGVRRVDVDVVGAEAGGGEDVSQDGEHGRGGGEGDPPGGIPPLEADDPREHRPSQAAVRADSAEK
jgi:hypothetical protein